MRILILLCVISISCFGQEVKHTIGLIPASVCFNQGFFYSQGINYQLDFNKNSLFVSSEGPLFTILDAKKRNSDIEKYIPFLNQSRLAYGREIFHRTKEKKINNFQIQIGYHYLQHGAENGWDYWHIDSVNNAGIKVLSGFQTHSATLGVKWSSTIYRKSDVEKVNPKSRNSFEFDYLFGLAIKLKGFDDFVTYQVKTDIPNTYKFKRNGVRFAYKYERFLSNSISLYTQINYLYAPFINYVPNGKLFIPRGGEMIIPFFPSFKIGLQFCF